MGYEAAAVLASLAMLPRLEPGTHRLSIVVPGLGPVRCVMDVPTNLDTPVPLVLALHFAFPGALPDPFTGGRLLESFRPGLAALHAVVLAPDSLGGRWTDAINEEATVALVRSAMQRYPIDPKRVLITGFSRGGEGAWHIGSRHQELFTGAIPVAAPVAGGEQWTIPIYAIHSEKDEIVSYRAAKEHADRLNASGARIEFHTVSDLTHYQTAAYASYLADGVRWMQSEWQ